MKTKLNKQERLKAYRYMLRYIKDETVAGFCNAYFAFRIIHDRFFWFRSFEENLPELMKYKPKSIKGYMMYWFTIDKQGKAIRIKILKEVIKKMTKK